MNKRSMYAKLVKEELSVRKSMRNKKNNNKRGEKRHKENEKGTNIR